MTCTTSCLGDPRSRPLAAASDIPCSGRRGAAIRISVILPARCYLRVSAKTCCSAGSALLGVYFVAHRRRDRRERSWPLSECTGSTSGDLGTHHSAPLATTADEGNTMKIAPIPIATADLGSGGGMIDGCARVHWRRPAIFPVAGAGSGNSYICADC